MMLSHIKPKLVTKVLQSLQVQPSGFHFFTLTTNSRNDSKFFISVGNISHVFGPLKDKLSVPWYTGLTARISHLGSLRKLYYIILYIILIYRCN